MKKLIIFCIIIFGSKIYGQDITGVYFHSEFDTISYRYIPSVTLFTDASMNISRPTIKVVLGSAYGTSTFSLTGTNTVNSTLLSTYSRTLYPGGYSPYYLDSFCVDGLKNAMTTSRLKLFLGLGLNSTVENTSPEAGNLPLGPSNFTVSGNQVLYNPYFTEPDGDSLSYALSCDFTGSFLTNAAHQFATLTNLCRTPVNAIINPATGLFSFSKDSTDLGYYFFSITVNEWRYVNGQYNNIGRSVLGFVMTTNLALGVRDYQNTSFSFGLYPNPAKETLSFTSGTINEKVDLEVSNALGEIVLRKNAFDLSQSIDVSGLQPGIYFLKAENRQGQAVFKIIKE